MPRPVCGSWLNNRTGPWYGLPARYCDEILRAPGVKACLSFSGWFGAYRDPQDVILAFAVSPVNSVVADVVPDYGITRAALTAFGEQRRAAWAGTLLMKHNGMEDRPADHVARHRRRSSYAELHTGR